MIISNHIKYGEQVGKQKKYKKINVTRWINTNYSSNKKF